MANTNDVVLSKETLEAIKKVFNVNQALLIQPNEKALRCRAENARMAVNVPIVEEFPCQVALYDVREFFNVVKIINEPILNFDDQGVIKIRSQDGTQVLKYTTGKPALIQSYFENDPKMGDPDVVAKITADQFKSAQSAAGVMDLKYLGFECDGDKLSLVAFNRNNGSDNTTNHYSIEIGEHDTALLMYFALSTGDIRALNDEGDLEFHITSSKKCRVECQSGKTFWLAMESKSTYGTR